MAESPFEFAVPDYPLAPMTFYRIGGPARMALLPRTIDEAVEAYEWMLAEPGPHFVLGGGTNVLISDAGFPGTILITTKLDRWKSLGDDRYRVEAGVVLDRVVREVMAPNNYDGTGGLTGIPGTAGGAMHMNAGTVNVTACRFLESVDVIGPTGRATVPVAPGDYGYRHQTFSPRGSLILQGVFQFQRAEADQQALYDHYIQRRQEKQPQGYCCGSVFKNPEDNHAGHLIESCGLKGVRHGGAIISPLHANFIMNEEGATFEDILSLIELCKTRVREQFGIDLAEEVRIIR